VGAAEFLTHRFQSDRHEHLLANQRIGLRPEAPSTTRRDAAPGVGTKARANNFELELGLRKLALGQRQTKVFEGIRILDVNLGKVIRPRWSGSETTQFQQLTVPGCCVPLRGFALEVEGLVEAIRAFW
jgi:hypothetical protein